MSGRREPLGVAWARHRVDTVLARAGVRLDGEHPWDPQIRRPRMLRRILLKGTLGAGEAYVDGDWDCAAIDEMTARIMSVQADARLISRPIRSLLNDLMAMATNAQSPRLARRHVRSHYDIGDDLYAAMLGPTMAYSCGYWQHAATLDEAQVAKFDLICKKIGLSSGHRVLDIGCGWGGFAHHAATKYGAEVVGITLSPAQAAGARQRCAGLPVEIREQDYRALSGQFDRIVSVGMFEHVGPANYRTFFEVITRLLRRDGLFLLHTIGGRTSTRTSDPWINRYVFPGGILPSAHQIGKGFDGLFVLEDWHNFGADYDRTLLAWHTNVESAWPQLSDRYSPRFRRLWRYYLLTCAGMFRARRNQLWQLVLSPCGVPSGYTRVT